MTWKLDLKKNLEFSSPIFIEGLPGIGNVGKIVIDYLIDLTHAKKIGSLFSHSLPNSVFVNQKNMITLPSIDLYSLKVGKQDFIFLSGDAQPNEEKASYELSEIILDILEQFKCNKIITLGGIGLNEIPEEPQIFVTGNDKKFIKEFKEVGANPNLFGVVGPIIGVSGLLLGLSQKRKMSAVALLGETFGHPMYIGLKEAKKILELLDKKYKFKLNLKELIEEINLIDEELKHIEEQGISENPLKTKSKKVSKLKKYQELGYIG